MPYNVLNPRTNFVELKMCSRDCVMLADNRVLLVFVLIVIAFEVIKVLASSRSIVDPVTVLSHILANGHFHLRLCFFIGPFHFLIFRVKNVPLRVQMLAPIHTGVPTVY